MECFLYIFRFLQKGGEGIANGSANEKKTKGAWSIVHQSMIRLHPVDSSPVGCGSLRARALVCDDWFFRMFSFLISFFSFFFFFYFGLALLELNWHKLKYCSIQVLYWYNNDINWYLNLNLNYRCRINLNFNTLGIYRASLRSFTWIELVEGSLVFSS